jgi:bifunctional non-homologous end joining protein LigD
MNIKDFFLTRKPGVRKKKASLKSGKLTFVIQEHHAKSIHYDFRLELDGVLKSWAIPKGPSLDPADKRLAVQTDDHPLEYAHFHGTIPKGHYGEGEVFIWDSGTWESLDESPLSALKKGHLNFFLRGHKLNGSFVLLRLVNREKSRDHKWLLIKHHDSFEVRGYHLDPISDINLL